MAEAFDKGASRRIALVVHPDRPAARALAEFARTWWEDRGHRVIVDDSVGGPDPRLTEEPLDLAISLGGDGTMLRTIQLTAAGGTPVLGVNLGALGYLTPVDPARLEETFEHLVRGEYEVEERMTLDAVVRTGGAEHRFLAMNDVLLERHSQAHTIRFQVTIGERPLLTYAADGFLVATPSGSTAYNLSLRGPIVSPGLDALVLTPIAPHMLFDRSLVIEPTEVVRLELLGERAAIFVADGNTSIEIEPGDDVTVRAGALPAKLVTFGVGDVFSVLREKFGLADR